MEDILNKVKKVHLVGIGGVGMTGLAFLLKERGLKVSGSDIRESSTIDRLRKSAIEVFIGHNRRFVEGADLVCFSSAIKEDNCELAAAGEKGIPIVKRGKLLAFLSKDIQTIAIAGSHGKTTTSALMAFVLGELGYNPHVFIGGVSLNFNKLAWSGKDLFVIETDESDGTFLFYWPWVSIITNIDHEHLDFYKNFDRLKESFHTLASQTKAITIGCGDDPNLADILKRTPSLAYGLADTNPIRAENIRVEEAKTVFDLVVKEKKFADVAISLLGKHNVLNALAVVAFISYIDEDIEKVVDILQHFKGTRRRFEVKATVDDVKFVDDYAHHPREIAAVLQAAYSLSPQRLVVVFQPHRYSRVKLLYEDFSRCFALCDYLIVTDIYSAGEDKIEGIDGYSLSQEIQNHFSKKMVYIPKDQLAKEVPLSLQAGDLVLGLGAGDINIVMGKIVEEFKRIRDTNMAGYDRRTP